MSYKSWFYKILITLSLILISVISINYFNDPLWVSDRENFFNKEQQGFNERQQKSNKIFFTKNKYDSIILGNSKVTYINQNHFLHGKLFNYAVSAMRPSEYNDYIEFFKENHGAAKYILLGIDFSSCLKKEEKMLKPEFYIQNSKSDFYQLKQLLSYDSLIYSLRNLWKNFSDKKTIYNRDNVKIKIGYQMSNNFELNVENWEEEAKNDYKLSEYDDNFRQYLSKIRLNNPNTKIITIFLPDFSPKFLFYSKSKEIYDKCLKDARTNSDMTYNFMHFSKLTINPDNYYDGSHFKVEIGKIIMDNIQIPSINH